MFQRLKRRIHLEAPHERPASQKVLCTYELLELILEHLDPPSLRQGRLINHDWANIIRQSSTLTTRWKNNTLRTVRTALIGAGGVGKRCLVDAWTWEVGLSMPHWYDPTYDTAFTKHIWVDGERWRVEGDSGGFGDSTAQYYAEHMLSQCNAFILVYSMTSRSAFNSIKAWMARMQSDTEPLSRLFRGGTTAGEDWGSTTPAWRIFGVVVSTKNDLSAEWREVEPAEGAAFARELGCAFVETSAATHEGVDRVFAQLCRRYKQSRFTGWTEQPETLAVERDVSTASKARKKRLLQWRN